LLVIQGKTLSIICSALQWLQDTQCAQQVDEAPAESGNPNGAPAPVFLAKKPLLLVW
jgi:hypothetical protein